MVDKLVKRMGEIVLIPLFHRSFADFESMLGSWEHASLTAYFVPAIGAFGRMDNGRKVLRNPLVVLEDERFIRVDSLMLSYMKDWLSYGIEDPLSERLQGKTPYPSSYMVGNQSHRTYCMA